MKARKTTYSVHRWLGLVVCVQMLAWSTGGFIFSILSIESVRGELDIASLPLESLDLAALEGVPEGVDSLAAEQVAAGIAVGSLSLVDRGLGPRWELRDREKQFLASIEADTGTVGVLLSKQQAEQLARRDFAHEASGVTVQLIESNPPSEFRGRPLPVYQVVFDHPKRTHIYIDARTGEVMARRNRRWRVFDFFWMLHTMDYAGRDNFNHLLLTAFSILAMVTSASGLVLWTWRSRSWLKRRKSPGQAAADCA